MTKRQMIFLQKLTKFNSLGQLSLEYLLLLGIILSFLLFFFPLSSRLAAFASFSQESENASSFFQSFSFAVDALKVYGDFSQQSIEGNPFSTWNISVENNRLTIQLENSDFSLQKAFEKEFDIPIQNFHHSFSSNFELILINNGDEIQLEIRK